MFAVIMAFFFGGIKLRIILGEITLVPIQWKLLEESSGSIKGKKEEGFWVCE